MPKFLFGRSHRGCYFLNSFPATIRAARAGREGLRSQSKRLPPKYVSVTRRVWSDSTGVVRGLPLSTAKSAAFPSVRLPLLFSSKHILAAHSVCIFSASIGVTLCAGFGWLQQLYMDLIGLGTVHGASLPALISTPASIKSRSGRSSWARLPKMRSRYSVGSSFQRSAIRKEWM